jgi:hypothetical protein
MKLEQLLSDDILLETMRDASVICLQAEEYPLLFCRYFITYLSRKIHKTIIPYSMYSEPDTAAMVSLQTTFLGQSSWYWLHADSELSKKVSEHWHDFLRSYNGPNTLIFCTNQMMSKVPASWYVLLLPPRIDGGIQTTAFW